MREADSSSYLATFAPAEFATLVHAEARRRGADHIRQLVMLGDGAPWIWNLTTTILPEATQIVDLLPRPRTPARPRQTARTRPRRHYDLGYGLTSPPETAKVEP